MRMTISQLEECERLLGTTCRLQFSEPPANYELAIKQLNALYRQLKYAIDNTSKYNHIAVVICVSEVNGELVSVVYETGKRGRPKKTFVPNGKTIKGKSPQAHTHLHCYLAGANSFSLAMKRHLKDFGGTDTDKQFMQENKISRNTFYKYKREILEEV